MSDFKPYRYYLITALLLLVFFAVRIFRLTALPLFIDEMLIVQRSELTLHGSPFGFGTQGKFLLPWITALFSPTIGGWWIPRVVTLLLILPGIAGVIAMGKRLHRWQTGWFALLLIILTPMLHFHDRLALSDSILTPLLTLFTLSLLWTFDTRRLNWKLALLSGFIFILALLAKSSAIVLLPLPLVAALLLPKKWTVVKRIKGLAWVYGMMFVLWLPLQLVLSWRNVNYFGRAAQGSTSGAIFDFGRILSNAGFVWEGYTGYLGPRLPISIVVALIAIVILRPRKGLYLGVFVAAFTFALILFGETPLYYRYWLPPLLTLLVLVIVVYSFMWDYVFPKRRHPRLRFVIPVLLILAWLHIGLPFIYQSYTNPTTLNLPPLDRLQYIEGDSAGTAIPETAAFLADEDLPIVGAFAQCETLHLYLYQKDVRCLNIAGDDSVRLPRINEELAQIETPFVLVLENQGYATEADIYAVNLTPVQTFERPGGLLAIVVYTVSR